MIMADIIRQNISHINRLKRLKKITFVLFLISIIAVEIGGIYVYKSQKNDYINYLNGFSPIEFISNPVVPLGYCNIASNQLENFVISGNYAFISDNYNGLDVVNITEPNHPQFIANTTGFSSYSVGVSSNFAYLSCKGGMKIYNITNPASPIQVGSYNASSSMVYSLSVINKIAYITIHYDGLNYTAVNIVNITDPINPVLIGKINCTSVYTQISVSRNILCLCDKNNETKMFNITDLSNPQQILIPNTFSGNLIKSATSAGFVGNILYLTTSKYNLALVNISNIANPTSLGLYSVGGTSILKSIQGNLVYLLYNSNDLLVLNTENLNNIEFYEKYVWDVPLGDIKVTGNTAYLIDFIAFRTATLSQQVINQTPKWNWSLTIAYFITLSLITPSPFFLLIMRWNDSIKKIEKENNEIALNHRNNRNL